MYYVDYNKRVAPCCAINQPIILTSGVKSVILQKELKWTFDLLTRQLITCQLITSQLVTYQLKIYEIRNNSSRRGQPVGC